MLSAVTSGLATVISWIGTFIKALITPAAEEVPAGALYDLLPLFAVGIAISVVFLGIKAVKSIVWGA